MPKDRKVHTSITISPVLDRFLEAELLERKKRGAEISRSCLIQEILAAFFNSKYQGKLFEEGK